MVSKKSGMLCCIKPYAMSLFSVYLKLNSLKCAIQTLPGLLEFYTISGKFIEVMKVPDKSSCTAKCLLCTLHQIKWRDEYLTHLTAVNAQFTRVLYRMCKSLNDVSCLVNSSKSGIFELNSTVTE